MRALSTEEKNFNKLAAKYGHNAFTAQDFDNNQDLKSALKSFEDENSFKLEDDFSNILEFPDSHHQFLDMGYWILTDEHPYIKSDYAEQTAKLFNVHSESAVKDIASKAYYETYVQGFVSRRVIINDNEETWIKDTELAKKIERFHKLCQNIPKAKKFITSYYPRWEKSTKEEKKAIKENFQQLIEQISFITNDFNLLMIMNIAKNLMENGLNQATNLKVTALLALKLPGIDTKKIAKKIVTNMYLGKN